MGLFILVIFIIVIFCGWVIFHGREIFKLANRKLGIEQETLEVLKDIKKLLQKKK